MTKEGQEAMVVSQTETVDPEDLRRITKLIRPRVTEAAERIVLSFRQELLATPDNYIFPAIWGFKEDGDLDDTQRAMYAVAQWLVIPAVAVLPFSALDSAQRFYVEFLVRELLIARILVLKRALEEKFEEEFGLLLDEIEPFGCA